ncbi:O-antigen ligase [Polaribacter sp. WD7]|uniref:O-antigen ligase family protein n=1 Tax=Polaribacter sp. WD7 TaxID=2269061 RepID=UPI002162BCBB|nr:O-antigen ligase family protein [Polaribacter sp. WD7]
MHPTYFSSFLLFSITFSLFKFKSNIVFNLLNLIISLFFIMLFSSRIILLILLLTLTIYLSVQISKSRKKVIKFFGLFLVITVIFIFNTDVVKNRFKEVMSQFNKPISGNYYNSTNTRIAIYKCNIQLTKELPFFGYGNALQNKLDDCYAKNYDSIFYKVNIFNTHNYYFYILLYGGWFFLILFLVYFYYIFTTLKNNMMHVVFFFQVLMINLTENYLSRHYGLFLFCFFITIFIYVNLNERNPEFREI